MFLLIGVTRQSDLLQQIQQRVPSKKIFSKDQIHLSNVVGQGMY